MTLSISIPDFHYAGFQIRANDIYPLGFIVPDGSDKAARDRKSTVDGWAKKSKVQIPSRKFNNQPMVGFIIRKSIKHQFSHSNVEKWRIIDPRGFELEISNSNMSIIIDNCIIDNGEIIDSCVWARDGKDNILLPTSTAEYQQAFANTQRKNTVIKISEVKLGDHIILTNGIEARYLGKYYKATADLYYTNNVQPEIISYSKDKQHVLLIGDAIQSFSSLKISKIVKHEFMTPNLAEDIVNQKTLSGYCTNYYDTPKFFASKQIPIEDFKMTRIDFSSVLAAQQSKFNTFIAERPSKQLLLVDRTGLTKTSDLTLYSMPNYVVIDSEKFSNGELKFELHTTTLHGLCQENTPKYINGQQVRHENLTFSSVEYSIITELGNPITIRI